MEPLRQETYIMRIFGNVSFSMLTSALFIVAGIAIFVCLEWFGRLKKNTKVEVKEEQSKEE
jgi:uncharacterized membrane protein YuzA (DUF378 family)